MCQQSELNGQPPVYKTGALPIELCWRWSLGDRAGGMIWGSAIPARLLHSFYAQTAVRQGDGSARASHSRFENRFSETSLTSAR